MGSSVQEVEMILPDGSLITAVRRENVAIFAAAMGGYGLIGLITSLVVRAECTVGGHGQPVGVDGRTRGDTG
jgi:FAD/FMN-containing dehydrogenase